MLAQHPHSPLFPYTTLFRSRNGWLNIVGGCCGTTPEHIKAIADGVRGLKPRQIPRPEPYLRLSGLEPLTFRPDLNFVDRKSTRLNSSHANISYAVFCLK